MDKVRSKDGTLIAYEPSGAVYGVLRRTGVSCTTKEHAAHSATAREHSCLLRQGTFNTNSNAMRGCGPFGANAPVGQPAVLVYESCLANLQVWIALTGTK